MSDIVQHPAVKAILDLPVPQRLDFFRGRVIGHRNLLQVRDQVLSAIRLAAELLLIFVHGPTGAGKTTVVNKTRNDVRLHFKSDVETDPGFVPDLYVKVWPPEAGPFSFRDLYASFLEGLDEPHRDQRVPVLPVEQQAASLRGRGKSIPELRRMVLSSFKQHHLRVLFLDDAQHMENVSSGKSFLSQLNTLKTLADETGVVIVLSGTHELMHMVELNGQLARRSVECHFSRYRPHDETDREEFANIVATFAGLIPMPEIPDLLNHLPLLYEGSLGLVGCLKPWLDRALARALERGTRRLAEQDLLTTMMPSSSQLAIAKEIQAYEIKASLEGSNRAEVKKLLGLGGAATPGNAKIAPGALRKNSRRVGERNPTRDPVGSEEAA